jgi:sugar lactone lactonase YvrE
MKNWQRRVLSLAFSLALSTGALGAIVPNDAAAQRSEAPRAEATRTEVQRPSANPTVVTSAPAAAAAASIPAPAVAQTASSQQVHGQVINDDVIRFASIPQGAPAHPEGMTNDAAGNIYAASFELAPVADVATRNALAKVRGFFPTAGASGVPVPPFALNYIYMWDPNGNLVTSTAMPAGVVPLALNVLGNNLFVVDVLTGRMLKYNLPMADNSTPVGTFPICGGFAVAFGAPDTTGRGFCALNDMVPGPDGRLYMSDNGAGPDVTGPPGFLNGRIFFFDPTNNTSGVFLDPPGPELDIAGFPEFGVNGIRFSPNGTFLWMVNMSTDKVYRVPVSPVSAGAPSPTNPLATPTAPLQQMFFNSNVIDGPDDIVFDDRGILWIASGQNHQIVALNSQGVVQDIRGRFCGYAADGAPLCLLQPSSVLFINGRIYIGNEANSTLLQEPASFFTPLKIWTVSRFNPYPSTPAGQGFGVSPRPGGIQLTWQGGIGVTGYVIARLNASGVTTLTPNGLTTSFLDQTAPQGLNCYLLLPQGTSAMVRSDLECATLGGQSLFGSPQNFTIRLNESNTATMSWTSPSGNLQDSYVLVQAGGANTVLPATATSASVQITGTTCFALIAVRLGTAYGNTDFVCGVPGIQNLTN